jgi:nucleoside-triphosphatase THEP1
VKHEGEGLNGLDLVDSNLKVDEMVRKYASTKKIVLTVMRDRRNRAIVLSPVKKKQAFHVDLDPDDKDVISHQFLSQDSSFCEG